MIGTVIRNERESKGLSLTDLAKKAKVGKSTLSELESNKHTPTFNTLSKVVKALS